MESIINRVIEIEDYNGNTLMAIEIDENGKIIKFIDCEIADMTDDYLFNTDKDLIRLQSIRGVNNEDN